MPVLGLHTKSYGGDPLIMDFIEKKTIPHKTQWESGPPVINFEPIGWMLTPIGWMLTPIWRWNPKIGENRQLVTDELVEIEK
jgi:hypothetical protein